MPLARLAVAPLLACVTLCGSGMPRVEAAAAWPGAFQKELERVRRDGALPGITAAVSLPDGTIRAFAAGLADVERSQSMSPQAVMPTGSVGKQFVAAVALALEREHRVDLDAPIERWFATTPWFRHVPNAPALTLRLLLMHRGGLGDHRDSEAFRAAVRERFARRPYDPEFRIGPEELISFILDSPPLFAPGEGFRYSETGYILAGLALERACGCNYYVELSQRFLRPLRLARTRPANVRSVRGLVPGYIGEALPGFPPKTVQGGVLAFSPATEWTGGGLFSNVGDLARWSRELFEERALPAPYLGELLSGTARGQPPEEGYGLGVRLLSTPLGRAWGHAGEFPGYLTIALYFPDRRAAIALQTNTAASTPGYLLDAATALMRVAGS